MGRQRRGSEDRRKAKKRKHSSSKTRSGKSPRTHLTIYLHWCPMFLLLSVQSGASSLSVTGQLGGSINLPCYDITEDLSIVLTCGSKTAYGTGQSKYYKDRVHKIGTCDLILQDLKTTDAGRCNLKVYANDRLLRSYIFDISVDVNLTAREGEEVMFDDLQRDAERVERLTNNGSIDVWRREQGVPTDRLMDNNDHLTIKTFRSSDAGTYRVLNSAGGVLVTVTLTEWGTESKDKQDSTHDDKTKGTERDHVWTVIAFGLVGTLIALIVIRHQYLKRTKEHDSYQDSAVQQTVQGP